MSLQIGDGDRILNLEGEVIKNPSEGQKGFWSKGGKQVVAFFHIGWGWVTNDELTDLRLVDPRMAP